MAYKNQNYMTNRKIKAEVDKNQKNYVPPEIEEEEEEIIETTLTVTVKNDSDELIEGASVSIKKKSEGLTLYIGQTDSSGTYIINKIDVGEYNISISANDYTDSINNADLTINEGKNEKTYTLNEGVLVEAPPVMEEEEGEI